MKINQVICGGKISFKKQNADITWNKKKFRFYQNSVSITRFNFNAHICKNIGYIFQNNPENLLRESIESETGDEIDSIHVKINNIQHSGTLLYGKRTLIKNFLVLLQDNFTIDKVEVVQEANSPGTFTSVTELVENPEINYLCINLKVGDNGNNYSATIRLQLNKDKSQTHITIITTNFYQETQNLVEFIEKHHG